MHAPILIDAFAGESALGNRAAVVVCEAMPPDAEMQALATNIGAPATAFVSALLVAGFHPIRWFAPDREIALCGHGALAAGHVLAKRSGKGSVRLRSAQGRELEVRQLEGNSRYELALAAIPTEPRTWPALAAALGAEPLEIRANAAGYALALYRDHAAVRALEPDPAALAALGNVQVSVTAPGGPGADITSRVFSIGGCEDAATGSAHAVLTPFWCARLERHRLSAFQASARGGRFECRIEGDRVWLGGECRAVT